MSANKYYVNSIGVEIIADTGIDLNTATLTEFQVKKPDGTAATWPATLDSLTRLTYTTQIGDFDQHGLYYLQVYVEMPDFEGKGSITSFYVYELFT